MVTPLVVTIKPGAQPVTVGTMAVGEYQPDSYVEDVTAQAQAWALANGYTPPGNNPPPPPPPPTNPVPTPSGITFSRLVLNENFDGTDQSGKPLANPAKPNPALWETTVWYASPDTPGDISDSNGGVADAGHVAVANGSLVLTASSTTPTNAQSWKCGYVDCAPFFQFKGPGYVEWRAQLPPAHPGYWAALVAYENTDLTAGEPYAEWDFVEAVSTPSGGKVQPQTAFSSWHPAGNAAGTSRQIGGSGVDLTGWHTYGLNVDAQGNMQYYFDGTKTGAVIAGGTNALEEMFFNALMSIGGTANDGWAGVPTAATPSATMLVDYVRAWN